MKARRTKVQAKKRKPATARARKVLRRKEIDSEVFDFIDAAARVLSLPIEPGWKPAIAASFATTMRLAESFMDFPLPDEAEPAPVFKP